MEGRLQRGERQVGRQWRETGGQTVEGDRWAEGGGEGGRRADSGGRQVGGGRRGGTPLSQATRTAWADSYYSPPDSLDGLLAVVLAEGLAVLQGLGKHL